MELKEYIDILLKRKQVIIWSVILITAGVVIWTVFQKPVYQASIKLLVQKTSSSSMLSDLQMIGELTGASQMSNPVNTQMELIKTRPILGEVIKRLDLRNEHGITLGYNTLLRMISVSNIKATDLIEVSVRDGDPARAKDIANMIGVVFVEEDQRSNREEASQIKDFIESQVALTGKELSKSDRSVAKSVNISKIVRSSKVTEQQYLELLNKLGEAKISEALRISNVRVVDPAIQPKGPIKPRRVVNAVVALMFGLLVGIATAIFLEYFDDSIGTPEELSRELKLPILGSIPHLPHRGGVSRRHKKTRESFIERVGSFLNLRSLESLEDLRPRDNVEELIMLDEPNSVQSEAFRIARTNVEFIRPDRQVKTIAVTSSDPGEGKTVFISNLAIALAQTERSVLLVDCDLRESQLHKVFGIDNAKGLSNVLQGSIDASSVIRKTKVSGLHILTAGQKPPNPSELFESKKMMAFLEEAAKQYECVLFDTPPVGIVTDAAILGSKIDGVIIVVDGQTALKHDVIEAKNLLLETQSDVLGIVVVKVMTGKKSHYYTKYYHH